MVKEAIMRKFIFLLLGIVVIYGCKEERKIIGEGGGKMRLTSSAFEDGGRIPVKYTADGDDISPPLTIESVPEETKSLALVVDDPDAPVGTWVHWIVFNILSDIKQINEGETPQGIEGRNDFGKLSYGGPAPPSGTHTYMFKLYALDITLNLKQGAGKKELEKAMQGHILEKAILKGKYSR